MPHLLTGIVTPEEFERLVEYNEESHVNFINWSRLGAKYGVYITRNEDVFPVYMKDRFFTAVKGYLSSYNMGCSKASKLKAFEVWKGHDYNVTLARQSVNYHIQELTQWSPSANRNNYRHWVMTFRALQNVGDWFTFHGIAG